MLVSTTIIESGIDIPQANTLVVERADMLGLSQLYQIRGRVGRSDVTAHAYLFYPDATELTPEARARLATLADHTELGAGFQIAMRDLEIRGAGDLLGAEQSGHVAALGFELYVEMLNEAVAELSGQARAAVAAGPGRRPRRRVHPRHVHRARRRSRSTFTAGSRSSSTTTSCASSALAIEDRYGPLPEPVENLFLIQEAKLKLALIGADYLVYRGGRATVGPLVLGSDELRALRAVARHDRLHPGEARGGPPRRRSQGGAGARRCYSRGPLGRVSPEQGLRAACANPNRSQLRINAPSSLPAPFSPSHAQHRNPSSHEADPHRCCSPRRSRRSRRHCLREQRRERAPPTRWPWWTGRRSRRRSSSRC